MAQMGRPGLSAAQKRELQQRWKAGQSLSEIGRAFERHSSSIHLIVSTNGGFVPRTRTRRVADALRARGDLAERRHRVQDS